MEIFVPKFNIDISGKIHLSIKDGDGAFKQNEKFNNSIHDDLKNVVLNHMGASSGNSSHQITISSNWFSSTHSEQDSKDGIFIWQSNSSSRVSSYQAIDEDSYDLKLDENKSETGSTYNSSWTCEGTWNGVNGSGTGSSGTFDKMHIGKNFDITNAVPSFGTTFATAQASGDFTAFTLDDNDVCRVTWTITIG